MLLPATSVEEDVDKETSPLLPTLNGSLTYKVDSYSASHSRYEDEEAQRPPKENEPQLDTRFRKQVIWISPALGIGIFLAALDQTIVACACAEIGSDLKALDKTSWIATAYFLTLTSFQPLYGKLSDIFGRKASLLWTYLVFGLGCLFCGLARNMTELIMARAVAGVGGGGLTTVAAILLSDVTTLRERGTWQGYVNIVFGTGGALGSCMGGMLVDGIGWRWIFLLQVPLTLVSFLMVSFILDGRHKSSTSWLTKLKRIDYPGTLALISAIFTLLFGLSWGSNHAWNSALTLGCLGSSLILFATFLIVEAKLVAEPIAPIHIICKPTLFACYLSHFFSHAAFMAMLYYIPLFFQAATGLSATQAGLRLMPTVVASICGSIIAGVVMQTSGRYYLLNLYGYTFLVLGLLLVLLTTGLDYVSAWFIIGLVIAGYAQGSTSTSTFIAIISNVSAEERPIATACSYLFRSLGYVVGISISASTMQQFLRMELHASLRNVADVGTIVEHVRESLGYISTLTPNVGQVVRSCYGDAIRVTFFLDLCLAVVAMYCSWFVGDEGLA